MQLSRVIHSLAFSVFLIGTGSVWAQTASPDPASPPDPAASKGGRATLPESVKRVERATGGEVLRAESMQKDGREVYRLKVLTADGRVRVLRDDPLDRAPEKPSPSRKNKEKRSSGSSGDEPPQY